jgi:transcriptional regulator with XRE-family HTH domain
VSVPSKAKLLGKLVNNKVYRDAYVAEHVKTSVPLHIHYLREERELTQAQLAEKAKTTQTVISRLEDPNYGNLTLNSLLKIASAFDIALLVRFVPFSRLLTEFEDLSPRALLVPSFEQELTTLKTWAVNGKKRRTSRKKNIARVELAKASPSSSLYIPRIADIILSIPEEHLVPNKVTPIAKGITAKTGKRIIDFPVMRQNKMPDMNILSA